ncbi:MAG: hypothetical protein AAF568_00480 [Pseudomonadota bacterium]
MPPVAKLIALTLAALVGFTAPQARAVPVTLNFSVTPEITDTFDNVDVSVTFENSTPGVQPSPGVFDYVGSVTAVEFDFFFMSASLGTVSFAPTGPGSLNAITIRDSGDLFGFQVDSFSILAASLTSRGTGVFASSAGPAGLLFEVLSGDPILASGALTDITQTVLDNDLLPAPVTDAFMAVGMVLPNPSVITPTDILQAPAAARAFGAPSSTVIPLPATLPLLLAGMAGLAMLRWGRG